MQPWRSIATAIVLATESSGLLAMGLAGQATADPPGPGVRDVIVTGVVVDQTTGRPLPSVQLLLIPEDGSLPDLVAVSDPRGEFEYMGLTRGAYELRSDALGFSSLSRELEFWEASTVELRLELTPEALDLDPVIVTARRLRWLEERGFYDRRAGGEAYTLTREEIEARNPVLVSDLFFGIPGVRILSERTGSRPAAVRLRGGCIPQIILNGSPFAASEEIAIDRVLSVGELEAVEVHQGATNAARFSNSSCGAIMVWTRRSTGPGSPLSWERLVAGAGVLGLIILSVF